MSIISNKDLEQFGNVINTLINHSKTTQSAVQDSNHKAIAMMKQYAEQTLKNQQQFIHVSNSLKTIVEKVPSRELPQNFSLELKKDFDRKVDSALEEVTSKLFKQHKKHKTENYFILIMVTIVLVAFFILMDRMASNANTTTFNATKYKLFLKSAKGMNKKNYLSWDSLANTFTLPELEEKLNKMEGKK